MGWIVCPQNPYGEVPILTASECDYLDEGSLKR